LGNPAGSVRSLSAERRREPKVVILALLIWFLFSSL
jgi:hypothetical protein